MKKSPFHLCFLFTFLLFFLVSPVVYADLYWESTETTKGVSGRPDESEIVKTYITSDASRSQKKEIG